MVADLSPEPIDSRLSSSYSSSASADAMKSMTLQWRPRSAPKTSTNSSSNHQRLASSFQFWGKKDSTTASSGRPPQSADCGRGHRPDADYFVATPDDSAYVDSVSNHLGRLTPATTRPASGSPNGRRDWVDSTVGEAESPSPQPRITKEEYMALPLAIQRKYFSALERLQFSQDSNEVDRIYTHYDLTSQTNNHRKHRPAHSSPDTLTVGYDRRDLRESHVTTESDSSWVVNFHDKVNKADLTREEQVNLIKHLRASVIIEAANQAYTHTTADRANDKALPPTPDIDHSTATLSSRRGSLDSMTNSMASAMDHQLELNGRDPMRQSLYDSFRWLDEEEDLDLGLDLDDYHANSRVHVPQTTKKRQPSFRRRISIKKSFARPSVSVVQPGSKETSPSPTQEKTPAVINGPRRLSRTLSIINPSKHFQAEATATVDPTAAHYRDSEARQKLRAYFASPSKFDEIVQYGFPSSGSTSRPETSDMKGHTLPTRSDDSDNMRSFLDFDGDEDEGGIHDDASSLSDPDSPKTPQHSGGLTPPPGHHRPTRSPTDPLSQSSGARKPILCHKAINSDSNNHPSSREMTLRMTLTRPDLRANEELIYGWQPQVYINTLTECKSGPLPQRSEPALPAGQTMTMCWSDSNNQQKMDVEKVLAGMDHWGPDHAAGDKGVMKRLWSKVRRA